MDVRILPAARERLLGIWQYTSETWGDEQADDYVGGLISSLNELADKRDLWRPVREARFVGVYFTRYRHHYIFFKALESDSLGVLSILHESMDLPNRLQDDIQ